MMSDFWLGLSLFITDPLALVIFVTGLLGGLIFAAIPGLSALTLASILLPFTALMTPTHAIMLFAVMYVSGVYGGAVTAILFNIPGDSTNAATAFDGYPMTLKGQSGKAIGAAVTCSAIGGVASTILMMTATAPLADWAIHAFGPPEIFALVFFGLSVAASVGAANIWKGLLSVVLGLTLATIGTDPAIGLPRLNFGSSYMMAGIHFVPMILGVFAVSEVFTQGHQMATGMRTPPKVGIDFPTWREFWRMKVAMARSIIIGFFAGILPGIGATLAAFLSYSEAVRWSRHPEKFGKGELEGVVAPETANNAATGAAMIPLLALGLPGGALTAIMLGAFEIHGMEPGPLVLMTSKDLVWVVFVAMLFANLSIFLLGYLETKTIVHLLRVPFSRLAPAILLIASIGAYALRNLLIDVWVMFIAGIVGYLMRKSGYSMAGIILGVILGKIGESAFVKTAQMFRYDLWNFMNHPIAAVLIVLGVASLLWSIYRALSGTGAKAEAAVG